VLSTNLASLILASYIESVISTSMVQITLSIYEAKIKEARFVDSTEGAPQRIEASDFIEARF